MPVFFIHSTQVEDERVTITDPLFSHLSKSLRTKPGDTLLLNDERGRRFQATVLQITKQVIYSKILCIQEPPPPSTPAITLAQAILKGEKMGWVLQKSTELGIQSFVPLLTDRVILRLSSENTDNYHKRWDRIALEAAQQSERWNVPMILPIKSFKEFVRQEDKGIRIILSERQENISLSKIPLPAEIQDGITVAIGPEGGWTKEEIQTAQSHNFSFASLGKAILRAETASLAALAILQARLDYL